jgi:hypothetical protein
MSGLEAECVLALGTWCSLRSEKKFAAKTGQAMHFLSIEWNEECIEDSVECIAAVAKKGVEDTEAAV